ncbi:unnamed protein product [Closterium sp. NIES-54]
MKRPSEAASRTHDSLPSNPLDSSNEHTALSISYSDTYAKHSEPYLDHHNGVSDGESHRFSSKKTNTSTVTESNPNPDAATADRYLVNRVDFPPVNPSAGKFPYCLVWTPLPVIAWLVPFIGHLGICREDGTILDFAGSYFVCVDNFAFGAASRYLQLDPAKVGERNPSTAWWTFAAFPRRSILHSFPLHSILHSSPLRSILPHLPYAFHPSPPPLCVPSFPTSPMRSILSHLPSALHRFPPVLCVASFSDFPPPLLLCSILSHLPSAFSPSLFSFAFHPSSPSVCIASFLLPFAFHPYPHSLRIASSPSLLSALISTFPLCSILPVLRSSLRPLPPSLFTVPSSSAALDCALFLRPSSLRPLPPPLFTARSSPAPLDCAPFPRPSSLRPLPPPLLIAPPSPAPLDCAPFPRPS